MAVPPRFKDHIKLICARHSRSGRKKYVKKYPERVRKVPSRKVWPMPFFLCFLRIHSHSVGGDRLSGLNKLQDLL